MLALLFSHIIMPSPVPPPPAAVVVIPLQYVLPTDSARLSRNPLKLAISPMLWAQHRPDRFDTWSAGEWVWCCSHHSGAPTALNPGV